MLQTTNFDNVQLNIKESKFLVIQQWMISKLKLNNNNLLVFGLIYGFSQEGQGEFYGSLSYISDFLNISRTSTINCLKNLVNNKLLLITKEEQGETKHYTVNMPYIISVLKGATEIESKKCTSTKTVPTHTDSVYPSTECVSNNIDNNKDKNINVNNTNVLFNDFAVTDNDYTIIDNVDFVSNNTTKETTNTSESNKSTFVLKSTLAKPKKNTNKSPTKRQKEIASIYKCVDDLFNNNAVKEPKLANKLKDYLKVRIGMENANALTLGMWQNQLKLLLDVCENDYEYAYEIVCQSTNGGYRSLCFPNQKKSTNNNNNFNRYNKPTNHFDTARNNKMDKGINELSKEEKEDYIQNKLATDDEGNPLLF